MEFAVKDAFHASINENIRRSAREWFASSNSGVGSYLWVCEHLDFPEPHRLRAAIANPRSSDGRRAFKAFAFFANGGGVKRFNARKRLRAKHQS